MISVGIDAVEIERFKDWHTYSVKKLHRLFTEKEIAYCISIPEKAAERFAVRFAAKEAFYKALSSLHETPLSFLKVCKYTEVQKKLHGAAFLSVDWKALRLAPYALSCSLSHTNTTALAVVIMS